MLFDEVDVAVAQPKLHVDLGMHVEEFARHRHHVQAAEHDRRGHHEPALHLGVGARGDALGLVDLLQDLTTCVQIVAARVGQLELAG